MIVEILQWWMRLWLLWYRVVFAFFIKKWANTAIRVRVSIEPFKHVECYALPKRIHTLPKERNAILLPKKRTSERDYLRNSHSVHISRVLHKRLAVQDRCPSRKIQYDFHWALLSFSLENARLKYCTRIDSNGRRSLSSGGTFSWKNEAGWRISNISSQ